MNNFDIIDANGNQINLTCNNIEYNGNINGNNRAWFTLSAQVQQNGGPVISAIYPNASWRTDNYPFNQVVSVTVNPLGSGDVDVYIN